MAVTSLGFSDESILPIGIPNMCRHIARLLVSLLATNSISGLSPRFWPAQSALHLDDHGPGGISHPEIVGHEDLSSTNPEPVPGLQVLLLS